MKLRLSALALGELRFWGCASSGTDQQGRSDPLEGFNRTMYNFNFKCIRPVYCSTGRCRPGVIMFRNRRVTV